ncbi:hypothetical protein ABE354_19490 [Brevibacillus laterosporus]|uniref:hypothetical protein n=2 Tax=Brevibacillus laterosporus TaxID=1465 RepID=UPI003D2427FB
MQDRKRANRCKQQKTPEFGDSDACLHNAYIRTQFFLVLWTSKHYQTKLEISGIIFNIQAKRRDINYMSNIAMITLRIILYGTMIYLFNMFISSNMIANGLGLLVAGFILEPIFKKIIFKKK